MTVSVSSNKKRLPTSRIGVVENWSKPVSWSLYVVIVERGNNSTYRIDVRSAQGVPDVDSCSLIIRLSVYQ